MARRLMQIGLVGSTASLVIGLAGSTITDHPFWMRLIVWALAGLVGIPVIPLIGACVDFTRRKEWSFAAASAAVLGLLAYALSRLLSLPHS
jgi:hypothetical protein